MTIHDIYSPFEGTGSSAITYNHFDVPRVDVRLKAGTPIYSTSLFPDPEGRECDVVIPRKGKTWTECYVRPLLDFAASGAQILLYLDQRLDDLTHRLPSNVIVQMMAKSLPGYDAMLWRYLGAVHGDVFFCGCDDFRHPNIVAQLRVMKFDLVRWAAPRDVDSNRMCIFRTIHGSFYLRPPVHDIAQVLEVFYSEEPVPITILGHPLFGNMKGEYGYDEVFTSRFFYYRYARNLATVILNGKRGSLLFEALDRTYIQSVNPKATFIYPPK